MKKIIIFAIILILFLGVIGLIVNQVPSDNQIYTVTMKNNEEEDIGTIKMIEIRAGVLFDLDLKNLTPNGLQAIKIHKISDCSPSSNNINMPNLEMNVDGEIITKILNREVTLSENKIDVLNLFDQDGSSIIIYDTPYDHENYSQDVNSKRVACGIIQK
ncbi:MAG: hypothetical protein AAF549_01825 [Pseudomonadota bacterium]